MYCMYCLAIFTSGSLHTDSSSCFTCLVWGVLRLFYTYNMFSSLSLASFSDDDEDATVNKIA